ncbi:Protein LTV1 [Amphibalanus amphitrite]|uniref:Protein LTV1 homolog n=1 Tax=Amphibalanus amphitrite TaxID=1232801 RepID=A0A6A4V6Q3_AMPAM|nr:protein LTV1 homolog [Amphibalanus amphitrite]XP_043242221.1 protein LTV1 homolog [Amphibalanus amphitrite]XP_043242222.1 protein LTV1 homolog [Amphibalanus amphitrite]KAF0290286.1 Protein LTV1 [Amphibalanus amphitrite]
MSRKRFIDKDKSVTFQLVHRSQRDPLVADPSAPQRVLLEVEDPKADAKLSQREQQMKYGIYFDDDYNYLQHIKPSRKQDVVWLESASAAKRKKKRHAASLPQEEGADADADAAVAAAAPGPSLQLPSSVFASHVEEDVGLLNRAAPDYGPPAEIESELAEVMDDDFTPGPEDELEDNFFELAGGLASDNESEEEIEFEVSDDEQLDSDDDFDEEAMLRLMKKPQARSQFTEYSTTSQGVLSTVAMEALNERFENFMGQYEDLEVGGLETEEIAGALDPNSDRLLALADEFQKAKEKPTIEKDVDLREYEEDEEKDDMVSITVYENAKEDRMDCESILSTYSNTRNRPKLIDAPNNSKILIDKKGMAKDDKPKLTKKALAQLDAGAGDGSDDSDMGSESSFGNETLASRISMLSVRHDGETPEERKARKHELKALRRERIQERKANQQLTKILSQRQSQSQTDKLKAKQAIRYQ